MAIICRATPQKGLDLLAETAKELTDAGARFVCLTNGDDKIMNSLMNCEKTYLVASKCLASSARNLHDKYMAAVTSCWFCLVLSSQGLSQMMGMRYGAIPIVRATGGLADTVDEPSTGIVFRESTKDDFFAAVMRGLDYFVTTEDIQRFSEMRWPKM